MNTPIEQRVSRALAVTTGQISQDDLRHPTLRQVGPARRRPSLTVAGAVFAVAVIAATGILTGPSQARNPTAAPASQVMAAASSASYTPDDLKALGDKLVILAKERGIVISSVELNAESDGLVLAGPEISSAGEAQKSVLALLAGMGDVPVSFVAGASSARYTPDELKALGDKLVILAKKQGIVISSVELNADSDGLVLAGPEISSAGEAQKSVLALVAGMGDFPVSFVPAASSVSSAPYTADELKAMGDKLVILAKKRGIVISSVELNADSGGLVLVGPEISSAGEAQKSVVALMAGMGDVPLSFKAPGTGN